MALKLLEFSPCLTLYTLDGQSIFHQAVTLYRLPVIDYLIHKRQADLDEPNSAGYRPLDLAKNSLVCYLLELGANPSLWNPHRR